MKRYIHKVLFLTLFLCIGLFVAGCGECIHTYGSWETVTESDCTVRGTRKRVCTKCGYVEEGTLELSTKHLWDEGREIKPATCEVAGEMLYTCLTNPEHTKTEPILPLNHYYSEQYTVDVAPTETTTGIESRHCVHNGCTSKVDERTIPKLSDNEEPGEEPGEDPGVDDPIVDPGTTPGGQETPGENPGTTPGNDPSTDPGETDPNEGITYRIRVNRLNGYSIYCNPKALITNEAGEVVYDGFIPVAPGVMTGEEENNQLDVVLPKGVYTVKLSNIPEGFEYEDSYTISFEDGVEPYNTPDKYPQLDLRLKSHLLDDELTIIEKGRVMCDFTVETVNEVNGQKSVTLSELLKTKKIVLLTFYFNNCQYCREEAPYILNTFNAHEEDMAVICFNTRDRMSDEGYISGLETYLKWPADKFYIVNDYSNKYRKMLREYGRYDEGVPRNAFIDAGGFCYSVVPGMPKERLDRIYRTGILPDDEETNTFLPCQNEVPDLPRKEKFI